MKQNKTLGRLTLLAEQAKRDKILAESRPLEITDNFPPQIAFVDDPERFVAAQCSRRAGKSNGLALRFFRTLEKYPGAQCLYLSLTRQSAHSIMWPVLVEHNDRYKIGCTFTESKLTMTHPNGSVLRLLGADGKNFIRRLKGIKSPGVAIDEAQDFGNHLQSLIDDVLTPTVSDYPDGWIALTGTPGPVPNGFFFEVTQEKKHGYSVHEWTVLENPHMPDAAAFIESLKVRRKWDETNPTLLREWRNKWVLDVDSLWIKYKADICHFAELPPVALPNKYHYIMGVDIGYNDADAIAVLAWSPNAPTTYLVEERLTRKQGVTDLALQIEEMRKKYDIDKIVIDAGALGKKVAEELSRRHQLPVEAADKARKQENVEFLNDAMRLGHFRARSGSRFAKDSYLVQVDWDKSTPDRIVIKKHPHSDIIDAVLYAFKVSPAYTYQAAPDAPVEGTKAWNDQKETEMFEAELAGLMEQYEAENRFNGNYD